METESNDDSGSQSSGSGNTSNTVQNQSGVNAGGTTVDGKAGSSTANKTSKPGRRLKNPLGEFASYNYIITLYMITPDAYDAFNLGGRRNINEYVSIAGSEKAIGTKGGAYIIAQSGGINNAISKRAAGFDLDYYIDDLRIESQVSGKETGSVVNATKFTLTIIEPYGFSFISKLREASDELSKNSTTAHLLEMDNTFRQFFILSIGFQGYDINGNLVTGKESFEGGSLDPNVSGTNNTIFTRFYDIGITKVNFKVDGKITTYHIDAISMPTFVSFGLKRGVVDIGSELTGSTVGSVISDLKERLNKQQTEMINSNPPLITVKNEYDFKFIGDDAKTIEDANIVSPADVTKIRWPTNDAKNVTEVNADAENKTSPNNLKRIVGVAGGTPIVQVLRNIVEQSQYILDALTSIQDSRVAPTQNDKQKNEKVPATKKTIKWFNVSSVISVVGWDPKIHDFAYKITYYLQTYETPAIISTYSDHTTPYYGPHKRYDYWYTGKNSEVISFSQELNNAYYTVTLGGSTNDQYVGVPQKPMASAGGDKTQQLGKGPETQNNYVTYLTDYGHLAIAKIVIMGDPDFLMTEYPTSTVSAVYDRYYGSDGFTINPNGGQVFIEINFYEARDYNNSDGTLTINKNIVFWATESSQRFLKQTGGGISYMVRTVISTFKAGKFTQELVCNINDFGNDTTQPNSDSATNRTEGPATPAAVAAANSENKEVPPVSVNSSNTKNNATNKDPETTTPTGNGPTGKTNVVSDEIAATFNPFMRFNGGGRE